MQCCLQNELAVDNGNIGTSTNSSRSVPRFGVAKVKTT
jgi:hypothetical protein